MRYFFIILVSLISLPTFASVLEGDTITCTMPDGSFREECIYRTTVVHTKMSPRAALQDGTWESVSHDGKAITGATLTFAQRKFSAKVCNRVSGSYGVFQDKLTIRNTLSTRMYCEGIMELEYSLSAPGRHVFMVGSDTLTITTKAGNTIIWKKKDTSEVQK